MRTTTASPRKSTLTVPLLLAASLAWGALPASAEIIPAGRLIDWKPGLQAPIPTYPQFCNVKDAPYNATGNGTTDDAPAIQAAINACPAGRAVFIPAGTYRLNKVLDIQDKGIVIRGQGPDLTHLRGFGTQWAIISFFVTDWNETSAVSAGATKGSNAITVATPAPFATGDYILLDQANDPAVTFGMLDYQSRAVGQIVRIAGKSGSVLTLNRQLYYTYNPSMSIQIKRLTPALTGGGVEDLSVERAVQGGDYNIYFEGGINCWVRNVQSFKVNRWHVRMEHCYGCEVRECLFSDAWDHSSDHGYGVGLFGKCTDNLVEDNIMNRLRHSMVIEYGGCGNVFGYNFSKDPFDDNTSPPDWLMADMNVHGGSPYMNLFEGNVGAHMSPDYDIGSSFSNTYFRNQATAQSLPSVIYHLIPADIQAYNYGINVVGCVLGRPGFTKPAWRIGARSDGDDTVDPKVAATLLRHGNYNYSTGATEWDPTISDQSIPASLYLAAKPSFLGGKPWPLIGPDIPTKVVTLPAQDRFYGTSSVRPAPPTNLRVQ